jgi:hypothetical protein
MTSLEAIAQKLEEERQNKLESILRVSGSAAIAKNEYNVTIVDDSNIASSLLFKTLNKPKFDNDELIKAIDVSVTELKPNIPTIKKDLIPKPLYDEQVVLNADLSSQIKKANDTINSLNESITNIRAQLQSEINSRLSTDQTNDALVNQLDTLSKTIDDFATQISTALQKSIEESILRTSLQAQNTGFKSQIESLIKQIDSLNSIIEGLQAQLGAVQQQQAIVQGTQAEALAAGADVVNDVVVVKIKTSEDPNQPPIYGKINAKGGSKWVNGQAIIFVNNDKNDVQIDLSVSFANAVWFSISERSFNLSANGGTKEISLSINENACKDLDSRRKWLGGYTHSKDYEGNNLIISITRSDGVKKSKDYKIKLTKNHPGSF